jgi:cytochrome c
MNRPLRRVLVAVALSGFAVAPLATAAGSRTADARTLLTQYKCYICHADRVSKAGPAYVQVAAHFRDKPNAVSTIAREIRHGLRRGGPWHMPPHPEVSAADARAMARYIMSVE